MASEGPKISLITQEGDNLEVVIALLKFILVNNNTCKLCLYRSTWKSPNSLNLYSICFKVRISF